MIQGTTPTITLRLPMPVSTLAEAEFVLADYNDEIKRTWMLSEMGMEGSTLTIHLTQEDTLLLEPILHKAQLRVKTLDGEVMATKIFSVSVQDLLSKDVI